MYYPKEDIYRPSYHSFLKWDHGQCWSACNAQLLKEDGVSVAQKDRGKLLGGSNSWTVYRMKDFEGPEKEMASRGNAAWASQEGGGDQVQGSVTTPWEWVCIGQGKRAAGVVGRVLTGKGLANQAKRFGFCPLKTGQNSEAHKIPSWKCAWKVFLGRLLWMQKWLWDWKQWDQIWS